MVAPDAEASPALPPGVGSEWWAGVRRSLNPPGLDPLATRHRWEADSNQDFANFGASVGTAGDVNGDGYDNAIVGAYLYDNGQISEGAVFVYRSQA
jgi:hypothetical protein